MSHAPKLWEWEGEQLSAADIHKRASAYSITILRQALKDGATCLADLHQRHAEGLARQKVGSANNSRSYWRGSKACAVVVHEFDGEKLSMAEIHRRNPQYSQSAIEQYVKSGARTPADLDEHYKQGRERQMEAIARGRKTAAKKRARACSTR